MKFGTEIVYQNHTLKQQFEKTNDNKIPEVVIINKVSSIHPKQVNTPFLAVFNYDRSFIHRSSSLH